MSEIDIRTEGRAGRITLNRPQALNALTHEMALAIEAALDTWADDDAVALVVIDAAGERAFCAGGDIQKLYRAGMAGDYEHGRRFWRDEYRLNARIAEYPKPYVAFMQGFTMGGGVGISCHGSHRIVCDNSRVAMPECGIGLVPDVGGSLLLARAPGRAGEYLALTSMQMGPGDAIHAGFADSYIPRDDWTAVIADLCRGGDAGALAGAVRHPPEGRLAALAPRIDADFGGETLRDIINALKADDSDFARDTLATMRRNSPLSMACAVELIHRNRGPGANIRRALDLEYRFTWRAQEMSDFLEGIRAAVIDKDRAPKWRHDLDNPPALAVSQMLMPLGAEKLTFHKEGVMP